MKPFFRSIRWQIQIWYGLLLLFATGAFSLIIYQIARLEMEAEIDRQLGEKVAFVLTNLRKAAISESKLRTLANMFRGDSADMVTNLIFEPLRSGQLQVPESITSQFSGYEPGYAYYRIVDAEGVLVIESDNAPEDLFFPPIPEEGSDVRSRTVGQLRERSVTDQSGYSICVGEDMSIALAELKQTRTQVALAGLGLWVLGLLGGWVIAGMAIRPIKTISTAAVTIAEGNLSEQIPVGKSGNELNDLAFVLNRTFARLDEAFQRQRQFTADASHELRTPLTVILSETQRLQKKPRTSEEYREGIEVCHLAAQRMKKLVEGLLFLARIDSGNTGQLQEPCQLEAIIAECIHDSSPLAEEKKIQIHENLEPVQIMANPLQLSILLGNLIGNAIAHHQGNGAVWVSCSREAKDIVVSVKDDGPGIPEADLPHLFERFYRVDSARAPHTGHSGLGLSISQSIAHQLHGEITVASVHGEGSTFTVRLPA
jgi:two-component system OmpR family sensor kinase